MNILITGVAGFIGARVCELLLARGDEIVGVDNLNAYYDVTLKEDRLARLHDRPGFRFHEADIEDRDAIGRFFTAHGPERVIHLAARAGVRYSLENPHECVNTNILGTLNVLEACRSNGIEHLVFASSSSVYGTNTKMPFSTEDNVDHPISLYAATKKSNELMAHTYSHLYQIPVTGLRFFTVYGPWGRPDMSLFMFTRNILAGEPINVFNFGNHKRDFTYIDDIAQGVIRVLDSPPSPDVRFDSDRPNPASSAAPYRLYNIGNNSPVDLVDFIGALEDCLGRKAKKNMLPLQPGDVPDTYADVDSLVEDIDYCPETPILEGIASFVSWYKDYYGFA